MKTIALGIIIFFTFLIVGGMSPVAAQVDLPRYTGPNPLLDPIAPPPGVEHYQSRTADDIALIFFISNMISIFAIVMGIYVLFNFITAGMTYVASTGDAGAHEKVRHNITQSVIGLILIVMAYTITGVVSLVFFGDPAFILSPSISRF